MADKSNKKKTQLLLFLLAFVAIIILAFFSNYRSTHVQKLNGPSSGVEQLYSCRDKLVAISRSNEVYSWPWNDLSAWPEVVTPKAHKLARMSFGRMILVPSANPGTVVLTNWDGDEVLRRFSLGLGSDCRFLKVSTNGSFAVLALESARPANIQLVKIDPNAADLLPVVDRAVVSQLSLNDIGISNDGLFLVAVGKKAGGWILLADARNRKILWEQTLEGIDELNNVVFSAGGQVVYASEPGRFVYAFEITTGKLLRKFEIDEYKTPPNNPQVISCIAVSPNGHLLAAATEPASNVWIWDTNSGLKVGEVTAEKYTIAGVAFSPDSSLLATGILVSSTINIWKIPERP